MSDIEKSAAAVESSPSPSLEQKAGPHEDVVIDALVEKRILRKLDWTIIPPLWFLFLVSFVDRGNIGNAKIQGMTTTLHLQGNQYNMAVMVFTLAYVVFGVPANIVFKLTGPRSLPVMMFCWGLLVIGQGLTHTYGGLIACRFLMGVFEAGFVPGCAYLIGSYYKRNEFLRRYTVFFSAAIIAGAFNGLFATLLSKANGRGGLEGWRWIFVVEGIITSCVSIISFFLMPRFPADTTIFNAEEKAVLLERLRLDGGNVTHDSIGKHVLEAMTDWKVWLGTLIYIGAEENASSVVAFQPTVLQGLGFTATQAQIHSIPIYCTAFAVSLICAWISERLRKRYFFILFGSLLMVLGLALELGFAPYSYKVGKVTHKVLHAHPRYAGMFFLTTGAYIVMPITVVWLAINVGKGIKRTVAFGMVIAVGNCGALISSNVFITKQSPSYKTGFKVGLGMAMLTVACSTIMWVGLLLENRKRDKKWVHSDASPTTDVQLEGEHHPSFRYQL